jgi:hypothetical protein
MIDDTETISVDLPKKLVQNVAYLMYQLNDDEDYWVLYSACLKAVAEEKSNEY